MKIITIAGFLVLALCPGFYGQETKPTPNPFERLQIIIVPTRLPQFPYKLPTRKCSIVEGQQFCIMLPPDTIKLGEKIIVYLYLANETLNTIPVMSGGQPFDLYKVTVTDPSGNRVPSIVENLKKQIAKGIIQPDELTKALPPSPVPSPFPLGMKNTLQQHFDLRQYYDFKTTGKYLVKIDRRVIKQNGRGTIELAPGIIEIEIN